MGLDRVGRAAALVLCLPGCSLCLTPPSDLPPFPDAYLERRFTPDELAADVDDYFAIIEEVHPDPYTVVSRSEVARRRAELVAGLDRPLTRAEFQPRVAELVAVLGDGNTSLALPWPEWWRYVAGPEGCFPLDLEWTPPVLTDARPMLVVRRTAVVTEGGDLAPGARVLLIGSRDAVELLQLFLSRQSGETEAFRAGSVEYALPLHLWLEGLWPPFALRVASAVDGHKFDVEAPGLTWSAVQRDPTPDAKDGAQRWALERRPDAVALLTIDTPGGEVDAFEDFTEQVFTGLAAQPPRGLVIDLRRNGGGDSRLGDELLQYLSDRPWRQSARKEWKMSDRYRDRFKARLRAWIRWMPLQYLHPQGWAMWTTPAREFLVEEYDYEEPRDELLRWRGPLAWLIGPGTFSSAASLAAAVQDADIGLLVGEPTGGVCDGFCEVMPIEMPRTRLGGQASSARFVGPSGEPQPPHGVPPHLTLCAQPGDPGDTVLEVAVASLVATAPANRD